MRRLKIILAALFITSISASASWAQRSAYVEPGRYEIEVTLTGKVLDLRQEDMRSVQQYYRGNVVNQQWDIERAGDNFYYIRSAQNGAYLGIEGSSREGARVVATPNNRQNMWRFVQLSNGNMMLIHRSGVVLDLTNGARHDGALMQVWSQAANAHQQFRLVQSTFAGTRPDSRSTSRFEDSEGYRAGVNDRALNLSPNYRRHRELYERYSEREFEQSYNAGYNSERRSDDYDRGRHYDDREVTRSSLNQSERRVYDDAYRLGQQDAQARYGANYRRYSDRYSRWQEDVFRRGYEAGYNGTDNVRYDNDQFDLNRLTPSERNAYDAGYRLGQQDARYGYSLNYRRYINRLNDDRLEPFFQRGYEVGYNRTRQY